MKRPLSGVLTVLLVGNSVQQAWATVIKATVKTPVQAVGTPVMPLSGSFNAMNSQSTLIAPTLGGTLPLLLPNSIPGVVSPNSPTAKAVPQAAQRLVERAASNQRAERVVPLHTAKPGLRENNPLASTPPAAEYSAVKKLKTTTKALKAWTGDTSRASLAPRASPASIHGVGLQFWDNQAKKEGTAPTPVFSSPQSVRTLLKKPGGVSDAAVNAAEPETPYTEKAEKKKPFYRQLWFWIAASLVAGAGTGLLLNSGAAILPTAVSSIASNAVSSTAVWGDWFMKALRWMAGPLVLASVTSAIGGHENPKDLGGLFPRVMGYFVFTTVVSVGIGLGLGLLIQPGSFFPPALLEQFATQAATSVGSAPTIWGVLSGIVPRSLAEAGMAFVNVNALQIVFMALVASVATIVVRTLKFQRFPKLGKALKAGASKFVKAMSALQQFMMALISGKKFVTKSGKKFFIPGLMHTAPIAVFGLLGKLSAEMGFAAFSGLGAYVGTVLLGLVGLLLFYSILIKFWGKRSPLKFLGDSANAAVTGFSTASSAATIPVSLDIAIKKHKISKPVAKLMITMGSAMNMEGTALYQVVALLFLAQVFGIALTPVTLAVIIGTLLLSSLGTPGSPGAGMAILTSIAISLGIPAWGTGLLLAVDRPLDMSRTAVNVMGDQTSALIIDRVDQNRKKKFALKLAKELAWLKDIPGYDHYEINEGREGSPVEGRHLIIKFERTRDLADFAASGKMIKKAAGLRVFYKAIDESGVRKMSVELSNKN